MRTVRALLLLAMLTLFPPPGTARAEDGERPFPVDRTTILREGGVVYYVEGTQTIAKGVDISCQKDVHIKGRGNHPTIRVEGAFKVHGVSAREVIFENVTVELAEAFRDVHLDMVIFREGGGVKVPREHPVRGKLFVENVQFRAGAYLDVSFLGGSLDLSSVTTGDATRIAAVDDDGKRNDLRVNIRGSSLESLSVLNADDVTVRLTHLTGDTATFRDCRALDFDGNKVNAKRLEIRHSVAGGLRKTTITKCDIYSGRIVLAAPKRDGKAVDQVVLDRCWFRGETDAGVLRKKLIRDAEDDEENGASARLGKISERPNELAGAVDR
jgi:hypothetical protein